MSSTATTADDTDTATRTCRATQSMASAVESLRDQPGQAESQPARISRWASETESRRPRLFPTSVHELPRFQDFIAQGRNKVRASHYSRHPERHYFEGLQRKQNEDPGRQLRVWRTRSRYIKDLCCSARGTNAQHLDNTSQCSKDFLGSRPTEDRSIQLELKGRAGEPVPCLKACRSCLWHRSVREEGLPHLRTHLFGP